MEEEKTYKPTMLEKIMGKLEANRHSLHMKRVPLENKRGIQKAIR